MLFNRKKKNISIPAHIVSADENKVVIELEIDKAQYRKGQMVVATVSTREKSSRGKPLIVSDVIAQGPIADISGKRMTISSSRKNPIVSQRAAVEAKNQAAKVNVRVIQ